MVVDVEVMSIIRLRKADVLCYSVFSVLRCLCVSLCEYHHVCCWDAVLHEPNEPTSTSQYEHSSIPATVKKLFNLPGPFLTARDAWAGTFDGVFSLTAPRTDCPCKLLFLITQASFSSCKPPSQQAKSQNSPYFRCNFTKKRQTWC